MALASWQKQTTLPPLVEGVMAGNGGRGGESKLKKEEKNDYFEVMKLKKL